MVNEIILYYDARSKKHQIDVKVVSSDSLSGGVSRKSVGLKFGRGGTQTFRQAVNQSVSQIARSSRKPTFFP